MQSERPGEAGTLLGIAIVCDIQGEYEEVLERYERALEIAREIEARPLEEAVLDAMEALPTGPERETT
jgi:hypothetical protein